jgi:hypothetical protein
MQRLMYDLRLQGETKRVGVDGNVCRIVARTQDGLRGGQIPNEEIGRATQSILDDAAVLESEWIFTGETSFQETGTIQFGKRGDRLRFSTFGSAFLALPTQDDCRHGGAIRWIEGGDGQLANVSGLLASVFCLAGDLSMLEHHVGVLLIP